MSISMKSEIDNAIIEFPIQSARDDIAIRDELHPTFDSQVIVHQQFENKACNKQVKTSNIYRIRDKERIFDPVEVEYERMEDTGYMEVQNSPGHKSKHSQDSPGL